MLESNFILLIVVYFCLLQKLNLGILINFNNPSNVAIGRDIIDRLSTLPHQIIGEENGTAGIAINIHDFINYINKDVAATQFFKRNPKKLTVADSVSGHPKKTFHNCSQIICHEDSNL